MSRTLQLPILFIFFGGGVRSVRGVQIFEPLGKKLLGRHALGGDFGGLSLDFGYQRMKKKKQKIHCLQWPNPVLPQGEGPLGGTLAILFQRIFGVVVQIFEPLGKKLLGRHAFGGDFGGLSLDFGYQRIQKKRKKIHCLQWSNPVLPQGEGPPRGNSREFFSSAFLELFQIFKKQMFMSRTLQLPILFIFLGGGVRSVRGVQIFEPLGKKLLGRHALGGDFGGLSLDFGYQRI